MDRARVTKVLIFLLCVLSAVIAIGLIAGLSMWPWIVAYWVTLTMKNLFDWWSLYEQRHSDARG